MGEFRGSDEPLLVIDRDLSPLHGTGNTVAAHQTTCSAQLLVDPGRAVDPPVLLEHRLDLSGKTGVLVRSLPQRFPPLPSGVETAAGHSQLSTQPGNRVLLSKLVDPIR